MRLYLILIALPVLGLPGPNNKRSSTPPSWWSPLISPSNSPVISGAIELSRTPLYSPTPHLSSSIPNPSPPRFSSQPIPSKSLSLPASSTIGGTAQVGSGFSTSPSHTPKFSFTAGKSSSLFNLPSSSPAISRIPSPTSHFLSKYRFGSHSPSTRPLSANESSGPSTNTNLNQSPTRSLTPSVTPNWTPTDKPHSPGIPHTKSKQTTNRIISPGAVPVWIYPKTRTSDKKDGSATRPYSFSTYGETASAQTYPGSGTTTDIITPNPSTVTISEIESVEGVEENTIYKTEKDGHETAIPILFGLGCLIFCNTSALLLWGIGPGDGKFKLPPIPGIKPLPKFIDIKRGVPTPEGTQGSDSEFSKSLASLTEESSGLSTTESASSESSTTEATTTESTSTCTRATITNCDITTSCGPKTCSTITSCEPTVADCTAAGTTASTTTFGKYELDMVVYNGHSLVTPSRSSTSTSKEPSYELTMAVYSGHSLATPSSKLNSSTPQYELTMAVYSATPSRPTAPPYELTMAVYSETPSRSSTRHQLTMAVYTGHSPSNLSTFRTYSITTTMTVGGSPKKTKTTKSKSTKVTKIPPKTAKPSCYPKSGDKEEDKVLTIENSRLNNFCGDPTRRLTKLRDPPRIDYVEVGWTLGDDAPKACDELPTTESDSEAYWVCTVALALISRDCPWNGGTISTECGEFRLRGCIGPCDDSIK